MRSTSRSNWPQNHRALTGCLLCLVMSLPVPIVAVESADLAADYPHKADEAEAVLRDELRRYFPASIDHEHGGFYTQFGMDWTRGEQTSKHIVAQSRLTWTAAEVARRRPDLIDEYTPYALHGLTFLEQTMWDDEHGGFHWCLDQTGRISGRFGTEKHVYGIAFGIYAAANVYRTTRHQPALDLAIRAYRWLEEHAHDEQHGGYFEALSREGTPLLSAEAAGKTEPAVDRMGIPYGYKSMNVHIHVLEAFTELYHVWPDAQLRQRLEEVFVIVRDRIAAPPGALHLILAADWRPAPGGVSFGHDVETAFLLLEAAEALGQPHDPTTRAVARSLVDHAIRHGYDHELGGLYDEGVAFGPAHHRRKVWWAQAEAANALVLMHRLHGHETDRYYLTFQSLWAFIRKHQLDARHGGWFVVVTREGEPRPGGASGWNKGADSKATYHTARAMLNIADHLRNLSQP